MITATSINEVIARLDEIIEWCKKNQSRMGYFATLYRKMTIAVQKGIANNTFTDGPRMELLNIIFANRYLHPGTLIQTNCHVPTPGAQPLMRARERS